MAGLPPVIKLNTCPMHMPEGWTPPVPAFSAKYDTGAEAVAVYVGVQRPQAEITYAVNALFAKTAPATLEFAVFEDRAGEQNRVAIAYFDSIASYEAWLLESGLDELLNHDSHLEASYGLWAEVYRFQQGQFETLISTPDGFEGVARLAGETVGPICEHGYWGGAEDRIPNAEPGAFDATLPVMPLAQAIDSKGKRIALSAPANACLIRSGQDLRAVAGEERDIYDRMIEPALNDGLAFLADNEGTGCFESRYMHHCEQHGAPIDKTFGMQLFLSIAHMIEWAKSHPTHLKIFHRFQKMAEERQDDIALKLWHEVVVLNEGGATGVYVNCNPRTGLLPYAQALGPTS